MSSTLINLTDGTNRVAPAVGVNTTFTIDADGTWTASGSGWTQTITGISGMTANMNGICSLATSALTDDTIYEAACDAQIRVVGQGSDYIIVKVTNKPSVDIACNLLLLGDEE